MESWAIAVSLAVATLVSEDLACVAAGIVVAEGGLGLVPATLACFVGILVGDLALFLAARVLGRRVLDWPPIKRRLAPDAIERSSAWIQRRGALVVLASRFTPGTRLPTYLAAGLLHTDIRSFVAWFALAAALWTPLVVGSAALAVRPDGIAGSAIVAADLFTAHRMALLAVLAGLLWVIRVLRDWPTRRRLYARWRRATRWEFWPIWIFYPPVLLYIVGLMIRFRGMTVFTAANPAIPGGGFVGESKFDILRELSGAGNSVAHAAWLPADVGPERRLSSARQFIAHYGLAFPVVLKPDRGQRGSGVTIIRSMDALTTAIAASRTDVIIQEYVPGHEFGVFYARHPAHVSGRIISLTEKRFPAVVGDGLRTLGQLILADDRAVCMERLHCRVHSKSLQGVPDVGERVQLVEIGSHCRGSLFLDAVHLLTPEMEASFDEIARQFDGFFFGRFDVRTPSVDDFRRGTNFRIVELNGVTSEATHIYDPANGLRTAYGVLFEQWRLAFEIGAANIRRGVTPTPIQLLLAMLGRSVIGVTSRPPATSNHVGVRV
jgi:membrane protein DedA with SNARE-associated domain